MERLNARAGQQITLISAPAGFGKTTLLAEWVPTSQHCVTWVSLDDGDNDPTRFWGSFFAALQRLDADLGQSAQQLLESPQPAPIEAIISLVINEISACPVRFVHVFDDYHFIENPAIDQALTFLLEHLPPNLDVIIASRVDPALPLARWRGRGQLVELRVADLRFTLDEIAAFLNGVRCLSLSDAQIAALEDRTEGWIAGLQLAALSMQGHADTSGFIRAFTGSNRFVLGYLAEEVLNGRSEATLDFLLQTSILDRLSEPLCDAVTGGSGSQAILEALEHDNLFIIPLDDESKWYRYHHLFAEVLRARLRQTHPELIQDLHRRASTWYEQHGSPSEAVSHTLMAQDFAQAARLIESIHGAKWQAGEIKTVQGWLAAMPAEAWRIHPRLWLVQAWAAMTVGDFTKADADLQAAEAALARTDEDNARLSRPEVAAFRASYASLTQAPLAIELAQQALRDLPRDYWMRGMLVVFLGAAHYSAGELLAATQVLAEVPQSPPGTTARQPHAAHLLAFGSQLNLAKGKLREARRLLAQALAVVEPGGKPIPYVGTLLTYMTAGMVLYEADELDQVAAYLTRCHALAVEFGSAEVQIYALSYLARVCLARNDIEAATDRYDQVERLIQAHAFSPSIMAYVNYHRLLLLIRQVRIADLRVWAETHGNQPGPLNAYAFHRLALPQIHLASGSPSLARDKLTVLIQEAEATGHQAILIKALILEARTFEALGMRNQALVSLARALTLSEPEGFVRSFVDEGRPIQALLGQVTGERQAYARRLLAAFVPAVSAVCGTEVTRVPVPPPLQPLRDRELEVLRLIAQGYSNHEIASRLVLGLSTIKTHINNLFRKLDVTSRTQAIARARELGLL